MPPFTQTLIIANVAVFFLTQLTGFRAIDWFALWPTNSGFFMPWQLVSYAFLHANLAHLLFNLFGLWMFGSELERAWGWRRFATFYFICVLTAAAVQLIVMTVLGRDAPMVGASGGLFGLLIGFAMVFPNRKMLLLLPPISLPAWLFATLYGLLELTLGVTASANGVAHFAHLGGLAGGWMTLRHWRGQFPFGRNRHL